MKWKRENYRTKSNCLKNHFYSEGGKHNTYFIPRGSCGGEFVGEASSKREVIQRLSKKLNWKISEFS